MEKLLIISPFNPTFFLLLGLHLALAALLILLFRNRPEPIRRRLVAFLYIGALAGFAAYKVFLPTDLEYMKVYDAAYGGFNYWNELPLNPCNIALILIPFAVMSDKRPLLSFCFYLCSFGPLTSFLFPLAGFSDTGLFTIHAAGYYVTHMMLLIVPFLLIGLKLYIPKFRDVPVFLAVLAATAFIVFLIDILMRRSGLNPAANYFFCVEDEENGILSLFYRMIPVPFLFLLPGFVLIGPIVLAVTAVSRGMLWLIGKAGGRLRERRETA